MAAISQQYAEQQLQRWLNELEKVGTTKSYSINNRSATKYSLEEIEKHIDFWEKKVNRARSGGVGITQGVPRG